MIVKILYLMSVEESMLIHKQTYASSTVCTATVSILFEAFLVISMDKKDSCRTEQSHA